MAAPSNVKRQSPRKPSLRRISPARGARMPRELFMVAAAIGISRAIFRGSQKRNLAQRTLAVVEPDQAEERGRPADKPTEIPTKGWMDIAWRVYEGIQNDRVLFVAAGVTFYGLLAVFPATAAVVSL